MDRQNLPAWIATGVSLLTFAVVFFGGFATRDDLAAVERRIEAVERQIGELRDEIRGDIRALNNRIDNILLADLETPTQ